MSGFLFRKKIRFIKRIFGKKIDHSGIYNSYNNLRLGRFTLVFINFNSDNLEIVMVLFVYLATEYLKGANLRLCVCREEA